jgi:hypothetical protein
LKVADARQYPSLRGSTAIGVCRVVEDLAVGFFRGLLVLVHAIARLAVDFFWDVVREAFGEIAGRIFGAIFKAIAYVVRFLMTPIEFAYRTLFERVARKVTSPALAHLIAVAMLVICGFCVGFGSSIAVHAATDSRTTVALER